MKTSVVPQDSINHRLYKELFEKRNLSMFRIAQEINETNNTVRSWFLGFVNQHKHPKTPLKFSIPGAEYIVKMCEVYGLDLVYIMTGVVAPSVPTYPLVTLTPKEEKRPFATHSTPTMDVEDIELSIKLLKEKVEKIEFAHLKLERKVNSMTA